MHLQLRPDRSPGPPPGGCSDGSLVSPEVKKKKDISFTENACSRLSDNVTGEMLHFNLFISTFSPPHLVPFLACSYRTDYYFFSWNLTKAQRHVLYYSQIPIFGPDHSRAAEQETFRRFSFEGSRLGCEADPGCGGGGGRGNKSSSTDHQHQCTIPQKAVEKSAAGQRTYAHTHYTLQIFHTLRYMIYFKRIWLPIMGVKT